MSNVVVSVSARTDIGRQRAGNEDSFLVADLSAGEGPLDSGETQHSVGERGSLLVVSDGMGGAAAGEIASELAVTSVRDSLADLPLDLQVSDRLILAAQNANASIPVVMAARRRRRSSTPSRCTIIENRPRLNPRRQIPKRRCHERVSFSTFS